MGDVGVRYAARNRGIAVSIEVMGFLTLPSSLIASPALRHRLRDRRRRVRGFEFEFEFEFAALFESIRGSGWSGGKQSELM